MSDGERYKTNVFLLIVNGNRYNTNALLSVPKANAITQMLGNWQRRATITYCKSDLSIDIVRFEIALTKHLASVYAEAVDALVTC